MADLIPHLFRTEFRKMTAVLTKTFGLSQIEVAEDIVSETFLQAAENWKLKGNPDNPTAWLYTVAKNKAKDHFRRQKVFDQKITGDLQREQSDAYELDIDLSPGHIQDSQLQMMFALCHPSIPRESQIGLALRILCGLGIDEIAAAFLSGKDTVNKRLYRAREKLRSQEINMEFPPEHEIPVRLGAVLSTLYLLFSEGYYSSTQDSSLRKDLCLEAMRLCLLLLQYPQTRRPEVHALMALMCFHTSRFEARQNSDNDMILYEEQDRSLWNKELIYKGNYYLQLSAQGTAVSKYHLEAMIASYHSSLDEQPDKWEHILQLYNRLLQLEYSPSVALNRTYALARARSYQEGLKEALKLKLDKHYLYHVLLGELQKELNPEASKKSLQKAITLSPTARDKELIRSRLNTLI